VRLASTGSGRELSRFDPRARAVDGPENDLTRDRVWNSGCSSGG